MTCIEASSSVGLSWLLMDQVDLTRTGLTRSGRGADMRWLITLPTEDLTSACPGRLVGKTRLVPCCHCILLVE